MFSWCFRGAMFGAAFCGVFRGAFVVRYGVFVVFSWRFCDLEVAKRTK